MNRFREDTPYTFSPPKYSRFWAPFIYWISDTVYLHGHHKVAEVTVASGADALMQRYRNGDSLLIASNHSDHCDPHVLMHLSRRLKIPVHFMAMRQIFERDWGLRGKIMQRAGVFSIDREGTDLKAIKEAMRLVFEGEYPLVMFPEGEIYHLNEKLTPLNEGAATIMLRAARKLRKQNSGKGAAIVPTAIRYNYIDDISASFPEALTRLERRIFWAPQVHLGVVQRIYKLGEALLSLKEKEYLDKSLPGDLASRLQEFREMLIRVPEEKYFGGVREGPHPERLRLLRGKIRNVILAAETPEPAALRECYRHLDRLHFAAQLYSYPGQYLRQKASPDRIAETIVKLEEDAYGKTLIKGRRRAEVTFCPPIDVADYLESYDNDSKATCHELTALIAGNIQTVLESDRS